MQSATCRVHAACNGCCTEAGAGLRQVGAKGCRERTSRPLTVSEVTDPQATLVNSPEPIQPKYRLKKITGSGALVGYKVSVDDDLMSGSLNESSARSIPVRGARCAVRGARCAVRGPRLASRSSTSIFLSRKFRSIMNGPGDGGEALSECAGLGRVVYAQVASCEWRVVSGEWRVAM
ncbi:hypothetical protein RR46_08786 [Papilio xuthus]|uniref:Uncharacterized protein n=1 Tax=Papilio xuthus TaxID=66420 RepID=A0A194PPT6_PAPXU|nr:hypothetical protein RR46_08786 [Papilio xuthus]